MNTNALPTEQVNPRTQGLDKMTPRRLARAFNAEDFNAARAVQKANKEIAAVIVLAAQAYAAKKKIIFMGRAPAAVWVFWKQWNAYPRSVPNLRKSSG